jgi:predicted RNA binding protein YcfA (HicA-like mRNA interferase family)
VARVVADRGSVHDSHEVEPYLDVRVGELVRLLEQDGWYAVRQAGSHCVYRHPTKQGQLVVPIQCGKEIATGTLQNILKKAGLK